MNKIAKDLKKGDKIKVAEKIAVVQEIEISDIGKHGKAKVRLVVSFEDNQNSIIIRPEDYPFEVL